MDTLEGFIELQERGYHPLLHNMCNDRVRGGFYHLTGSQEEDLIRRGNYLDFLKRVDYPIPIDKVVYSSGVTFTKRGIRENYRRYEQPKKVDLIACAAVRNQEEGGD